MSSGPFQIPGLTMLPEPREATAQIDSQDAPANASAPEKLSSEGATANGISNEAPSLPGNTEAAKTSESTDVSNVSSTAMELDNAQSVQPAETSAMDAVDAPESPPSLTQGLEALLGGLDPLPDQANSTADQSLHNGEQDTEMGENVGEGAGNENPEWEVDSSPYESSSESSSSDDSDDNSDSEGNELLNPEEMARILMEAGSDDEGDGKTKGSASGNGLRTKNELPEEVIPKPDVTITPEMAIEELGNIEHIVENTVVIKANTTGEYRVLDSGSVLCTEDRTVIAAIADLIGNVREPRYTARFTNEEEMKAFNLEIGTKIFYTNKHATFVFTQPLQGTKGTDASNWHDEEAGDDEVEFSDDEQEAAYKREQKMKKKERQGARAGNTGGGNVRGGRGGRGGSHEQSHAPSNGLNYDDEVEDGSYRKLARPAGYGMGATPGTSTFSNGAMNGHNNQGASYRGRGDRDFRGRSRGRSHDRGGRGNHRGQRDGYSQPPRSQTFEPSFQQQQPQQQQPFQSYPPPLPSYTNQVFPPPPPQFTAPGTQQFPLPVMSWPQTMPGNFVPPPPPQFQQQQGAQSSGTILNPAFFAALQSQFQGQGQSHNPNQNPGAPQQGQWPHQHNSG